MGQWGFMDDDGIFHPEYSDGCFPIGAGCITLSVITAGVLWILITIPAFLFDYVLSYIHEYTGAIILGSLILMFAYIFFNQSNHLLKTILLTVGYLPLALLLYTGIVSISFGDWEYYLYLVVEADYETFERDLGASLLWFIPYILFAPLILAILTALANKIKRNIWI